MNRYPVGTTDSEHGRGFMKDVSWKHVVLFLGILGIITVGAVTLVAMNKDVSIILTVMALVVAPILTAAGAAMYQKMGQVQETTNGNTTKMMNMIQELQESNARLALKLPADTPSEILKPADQATWPGYSPDQTAILPRH